MHDTTYGRTAIVAMACLFPGASTPEQFWRALQDGHDARSVLAELPPVGPEGAAHRLRTRRGGFVHPPQLDLDGLNISCEQLSGMDRSCTWPVHVVRQVLDQQPELDRDRCGVVLGNYAFPTRSSRAALDPIWRRAVREGLLQAGLDPRLALPQDRPEALPDPLSLWPGGMPARVVSAAHGLGGPSLCLDAACASSLYAIDVAMRRLHSGEADSMIAGGSCVPDEELIHLCFSDLQAYAEDGTSTPFDAESRGILTGQGAAVVVLKRLDDALRAGDDVLAVVESVGISNDGRGRHLMVPSADGQVRAYQDAYDKAGVSPDEVDYVECHATGTPLGDRTELEALGSFWSDRHGQVPLFGSVKANVSHLLTVAGMSSLFKVLLGMRAGMVPPTIGVQHGPQEPRLSDRLVRAGTPWPGSGVRRAGVSAFGFGGTNAHLVMSNDTSPDSAPATGAQDGAAGVVGRIRLGINGIGLSTAAGDAVADLRAAQRSGQPATVALSGTRLRGLSDPSMRHGAGDHAYDRFPADPIGMRIPPNDLAEFNTQQLALMNAARDCLRDARVPVEHPEPRRVAVIIAADMDLDAHGHGVRFRLGGQLRSRLAEFGLAADEVDRVVDAAQQGIHGGLSANEVLSYIGNLMASRIAARWNFIGPAFTVAGDSTAAADAVTVAADLLRGGDVDAVLVGAVDLAVSAAALGSAFDPTDGAADAACCLYLTDADMADTSATQVTRRTYAVIESARTSASAKLERDPATLPQAVAAAIETAGWDPEDVGLLDGPAELAGLDGLARMFSGPERRTRLSGTSALVGDSLLAGPLVSLAATALALYDAQVPATPAGLLTNEAADTGLAPGLGVSPDPAPWLRRSADVGRRAVVACLGIAGTAAAFTLQGADVRGSEPEQAAWQGGQVPLLVPVAGHSPREVADQAARLAELLRSGQPVAQLARAGAAALSGARCRLVVIARSDAELLTELDHAAKGLADRVASGRDWSTPAGSFMAAQPLGSGKVAFVFPGAFNSYLGLGRDLFDAFPALLPEFEAATRQPARVLRTDQLYPLDGGRITRRELMERDAALQADIPFMLASGTSTSLLFTSLLTGLLGVRPDGAFGYSLGESSMLFAMGGWDPDARDDARISATDLFRDGLTGRMEVIRAGWGLGDEQDIWTTRVVLADADSARREVARHDRVYLTHVNTPGEVVLAGWPTAVAEVVDALGARSARAPANHVMHCPVVDPVSGELADLNRYPTAPVDAELISAYDYDRVPFADPDTIADRIAQTLRRTIDFPRLVQTAYERGYRVFIEVGPGGSCTRWVSDTLGQRPHLAVAMDRRGASSALTVAGVCARLLSHGFPVDVTALLDRMAPAEVTASVPVTCGGTPVPEAVARQAGDLSGLRIPTAPNIPIQEAAMPEVPTIDARSSHDAPLRRTGASRAMRIDVRAAPGMLHEQPSSDPPAPQPHGAAHATGVVQRTDEPVTSSVVAVEPLVDRFRAELDRAGEFLHTLHIDLEVPPGPARRPDVPDGGAAEASSGDTPPTSVPRAPRRPGEILGQDDLLTFAVGAIGDVFGEQYASIDTYARRVRLPAPPYLFVSRVTQLEGTLGERDTASITTEYDIPVDAWYATDGQVPPAVTIEAGQCDLLLAGYLGIDLDNQGERVYRLLDSSLTFHGDLPRVGQTLRYEITIDRWVKTPGPTLFFFRYLCFADGELTVELTNGCAGFFTDEELEASGGVVQAGRLGEPPQQTFVPLARSTRNSLSRNEIEQLSDGKISEVFGPEFDQGAGLNPSVRLAPLELLMIDEVQSLATSGGRYGLGCIEATKQLRPDGWYFTSHFTDDPVLPGSLVAEGAVQLLQMYAMRQGLHLVFADARFQPLRDCTTVVNVRGQIVPRHAQIRYRVEVKQVDLLPRPRVVADVTVYVGDKASVSIRDLAIQVVEKPGTPFAPGPGGEVGQFLGRRNRFGEPAMLSEFHMAHAAKGDLAVAMGPEFGVYADRRAPYIPNGDFLFVDRVMAIEGTRGRLEPGAVMVTEYDVPPQAWYIQDNGSDVVPHCVLMESSLQSAILLGYYLGATLPFPDESFRIRNLEGTATITRPVDLRGATVRQRSVLLASIPMAGSVLQRFSYELSTDGEVFYRGESLFGYFNDAALGQQLGLDRGEFVAPWIDAQPQGLAQAPGRSLGHHALARDRLNLAGDVRLVLDGGTEELGYVTGNREIHTDDWYFSCHFHTDPVMPGSLGVEAMSTALQMYALEAGLADGMADPRFSPAVDVPFTWRYRGQIPHEEMPMTYDLHVTEVRRELDRTVVVARGSLWRPGLRIYELDGLAVELRDGTVGGVR